MEAKKKLNVKKLVRIFIIFFLGLWVSATVALSVTVYSQNKILTQETEVNEDFWKLKVAISKCYLSGKKNVFDGKEIYTKKLYSSDCEADIIKVKMIATKIEIKGSDSNYEGYIKVGRKEKVPIKINDITLQQVVNNQEQGSDESIFYSEPNLVMYYSVDEETFLIGFAA